ncbi:MAG: (2Fe-2S)-binding protein, partial [Pseudomonadota bacterium]
VLETWQVFFWGLNLMALTERLSLLTGQPDQGASDKDNIVCSCFNIGRNPVKKAIHDQGLKTPAQISEALQAGSNCGSCIQN